jgi:hypothetical protein
MIEPNDDTDDRPGRPRVNGRRNGELIEERVRKLEASVQELQQTRVTEDAVADRVILRLRAITGEPHPLPAGDGVLLDAAGAVVPAPPPAALALAAPAPAPETSAAAPIPAPAPNPPPQGAVLHPPDAPDPARRRWLLAQLWDELRLIVRMYFDSRYRVSRTAQFVLPAILVLFALNYFVFSMTLSIPVVSPVLERLFCVLLGVLLYRILTREIARYRAVLDYLAQHGAR